MEKAVYDMGMGRIRTLSLCLKNPHFIKFSFALLLCVVEELAPVPGCNLYADFLSQLPDFNAYQGPHTHDLAPKYSMQLES